jgi:acyl-CoA thioester hydrolase
VRYRKPLRFDDEVEIRLSVAAATRATFQMAYLLSVDGDVRALAVTVHGCVDRRGRAARLPEWVTEVSRPIR